MTLGLVCDACDALSPINATVCQLCGASLGVAKKPTDGPAKAGSTEPFGAPSAASSPRVCAFCGDALAPGRRFCGNCGKPVVSGGPLPASSAAPLTARPGAAPKPAKTMFFGAMQAPGRAKLILIKGEGMDGVSYVLSSTEHIAGRLEGAILFPEDPLLSPRHANFVYRDGKLLRARRGLGQRRVRAHHQAADGRRRAPPSSSASSSCASTPARPKRCRCPTTKAPTSTARPSAPRAWR